MASRRNKNKESPYTSFMREEVLNVKGKYPNLEHKDAFAIAYSNWKDSLGET